MSAAPPAEHVPITRSAGQKTAWLPFGASAAAMLAVGSYRLTAVSLDWDEGATLSAATRSIGQIVNLARHVDGVIAPYYLFMHLWTSVFGHSELALRAPSLIAMTLGVGIIGELGRRLLGPAVGVVAGLVCATLPPLSYYAAQARPYPLVFFLVALATFMLYRALERPSWARWSGYALCLLAAGLFHIMALTVFAAHLLIVAMHWYSVGDRHLLRILPTSGVAIALVAPLAAIGNRQQRVQIGWIPKPTLKAVFSVPEDLVLSTGVAYLLVGLAIAAALVVRRSTYLELLALALVPVAAMLTASVLAFPVWLPRYATFILGPLALLGAAAAITAPTRWSLPVRAAVVLGLLAAQALPMQISARQSHSSPDSRGLAQVIAANAAPGDGLVFGEYAWSLRPTVSYYLARAEWASPTTAPRDLLVARSAAEVGTLDIVECKDILRCLGDVERIWLVTPARPADPLASGTPKMTVLRERYTVAQTWPMGLGLVTLLVRKPPVDGASR